MMKNNFASIKSHKKLYKAGKTWMAATLLTVGLAGGAMLSGTANVHADTTTTVQAQQAANPELANAQSDAQKQQSTINSANAQLKDQQGQLSAAQGQQSSAQQALDQAKQAQQAATANDPAVKKAQADVDQAQQQVNNQKTVVDEAQTAVDNGQQNVESAANAVSQASQKVDQARQAAKDAINKAADQRTSEAQKTINSLENQGKSQASQNLDNQINNVKDQVSAAQKDVNNTNSQISNLQNQVKTLENQGKTSTTFTGFQYPSDAGAPDSKTDLSAYNNKYHYVSNPADAQVQIDDYANLSPEIQKELTIYAAQLVNSFGKGAWEAAGIPNFQPLMINDASLNEAKEAAQLYAQDNWSIDQHGNHDIDALNQAALDNGAFAREMDGSRTPAVDESATGQILPADRSTTLDKLKNAIFNAICNMLYGDGFSSNTHMMSLAQVWHLPDGWHFGHDWMGLAFDKLGQLHIVFAENNAYAVDYNGPMYKSPNYDYNAYLSANTGTPDDNSAQINNLNSQISNLQSTLASQNSKLQNLQTQLQNLQAQKANVQFDLSRLSADQQAEYNKAKNTLNTVNDWKNGQLANVDSNANVQDALNKLTNAKQALTSAKNTQSQDAATLQQAKDGLNNLNQVLVAKQAALDNAEQNADASANQAVKDAQAKLATINGKISDLQKAIAATNATISNAQAQLAKDNQTIADIKNNQKPVDPNKGNDKPTNPTTPSDNHKGSETPTTPAKPTDGNKDTTTPTQPTKPAKPAADNASTNGQAGNKTSAVDVDNDSEAVDTNADKSTVVLPSAGSEGASTTVAQAESTAMTREQYKTQQGQLPQTGNENSSALIALGALAGMFGLGMAAKGKKKF